MSRLTFGIGLKVTIFWQPDPSILLPTSHWPVFELYPGSYWLQTPHECPQYADAAECINKKYNKVAFAKKNLSCDFEIPTLRARMITIDSPF